MKKLNRIFMYIMMLFIFSHFSFSENENTEILLKSRRKEPAKLTIGVTKLKTKELLLDFDAEKKIIYGELPQGFDDNKLIFVSETLDEIPSLTVSGNKRKVNNIEKYFARNVKSAPKFIYEIVAGNGENGAEEGKKYLVIKCKTNISGVYVYVLEKESYKIKDVYRGKFENKISTLAEDAGEGDITFSNNILYVKEVLGKYEIIDNMTTFVRADGTPIKKPYFAVMNTPLKYANTKIDRVKISSSKGETGKQSCDANGIFSVEPKINNAKIILYTKSGTKNINLELIEWNGEEIEEDITITYIKNGLLGIGDENLATQKIKLKIPKFQKEVTTTINISNPIVELESKTSSLGIVKIETAGIKTLDDNENSYTINNPWIDANNIVDYEGTILGEHRFSITSGSNKSIGDTGEDGDTFAYIVGTENNDRNKVMWEYYGGDDKSIRFAVDMYDFKKGTYNVEIKHFNLADQNDIYKIYNYKIEFPEFDGTVYLDKTLDIGNQNTYEKQYEIFSAENGKILLGSVGLRELDRRITYEQNGGDGVSVRLLTQDVILKKENSEYTIKGILTIEDDNALNNEVRGENREDTTARKGNVYLTLSKSEEEKLAGGGKYHILTADEKEPLVVGVKADTGTFLNTAAQLWLVTDEKYSKVNIKFKNDEMPLKEDENIGWINYLTGNIEGYTGNWGEITGQITEIPKGTTAIYLLDENGKTLSSGNNWQNDISIGESKVTIKYDGNSIHFGVKEGNYKVGEEGKFFLRYVDETNKKYLKIEEVNVEFILNKLTSKAVVNFKNPMMRYGVDTTGGTGIIEIYGMVEFGEDTPEGKPVGKGNHSFTNGDERKWWDIKGKIEYDIKSYKYKIYSENKEIIAEIDKGTSKSCSKELGKAKYNFLFANDNTVQIGISDYSGESTTNTFYLAAYDDNDKPVRYDEVKIIIDEFDPNAYGKIVPVNNDIAEDNKAGEVGTGTENLKEEVTENTLIDLATNFRFYSRFRGIINAKGEIIPFVLNWENDVIIKSKTGNQDEVINGQLVLVEEKNENNEILNNRLAMEEQTDISAPIPEYYRLKVKLSSEEYKKLKVGTHYEIFRVDNNYHVMKIGVENENTPWYEELDMNEPLNFKTSGASIEIIPDDLLLDFGKINVNENHGKNVIREGQTFVTIIGREITDFEVTPNIDGMGETEIYLTDIDDNQDKDKKLQVSRLKAEKIFEEQTDQQLKRIYNFNGIVTVPPDSEIGEYTGETVITVTVIDE